MFCNIDFCCCFITIIICCCWNLKFIILGKIILFFLTILRQHIWHLFWSLRYFIFKFIIQNIQFAINNWRKHILSSYTKLRISFEFTKIRQVFIGEFLFFLKDVSLRIVLAGNWKTFYATWQLRNCNVKIENVFETKYR